MYKSHSHQSDIINYMHDRIVLLLDLLLKVRIIGSDFVESWKSFGNSLFLHSFSTESFRIHRNGDRKMSLTSVKMSEDVWFTCLTHALSTETEEIMGLLLGDIEVTL